jgi:hypothetical protein
MAALCTILAITVATAAHAETTKLQWGNPSNPFKKQSSIRTSDLKKSDLKFVKPGVATKQDPRAPIKLAAFEDNGDPRFTSSRNPEPIRSVVVNRGDDASDDFRAAQLPPPSPSSDDLLSAPFGENTVEPAQLNTPVPDSSSAAQPLGETDPTLPPPTNPLRFNGQSPSAEDAPLPGGVPGPQPDRGQLQPILPSGPGPDQSPPTQNTPAEKAKIEEEGKRAKESCDESLKNLREYTVDKVNLNIVITGTEGEDYPFECAVDDGQMFGGRCWEQITYMWKASALCHKPLYFEDEQLERYGHSFTPCLQPFVSGAHFFTRPFILPYCMGVEPPHECVYALGHYRPGNCAPYMCNPVPLSLRGALIQAGAATGAASILP